MKDINKLPLTVWFSGLKIPNKDKELCDMHANIYIDGDRAGDMEFYINYFCDCTCNIDTIYNTITYNNMPPLNVLWEIYQISNKKRKIIELENYIDTYPLRNNPPSKPSSLQRFRFAQLLCLNEKYENMCLNMVNYYHISQQYECVIPNTFNNFVDLCKGTKNMDHILEMILNGYYVSNEKYAAFEYDKINEETGDKYDVISSHISLGFLYEDILYYLDNCTDYNNSELFRIIDENTQIGC